MIVKDEALLAEFRGKKACEWCGRRRPVVPHHVFCRGMGGGSRLDVAINLIALCSECHGLYHDGKIPRAGIVAAVAARQGMSPSSLEEEIYRLRRQRK